MRVGRTLGVVAGAAVLGFVVAYRLGRTWGATGAEREAAVPGDEIIERPTGVTTHAITIEAPPEQVWPWLVQLGYHRGGWYTYPWVDRLVLRVCEPSAERVVPRLQRLAVGDVVPEGAPGAGSFAVEHLEPRRSLVLHANAYLRTPAGHAPLRWTWSFVLTPVDGGRATRLVLRTRVAGSAPVAAAIHAVALPSDAVMARSMLRGIRRRARASARAKVRVPVEIRS